MRRTGVIIGACALFGLGCGEPVHSVEYDGPPVGVVRGTVPMFGGLDPAQGVALSLQVLNVSSLEHKLMYFANLSAPAFPASFERTLTRRDAIDIEGAFETGPGPTTFGLVAHCGPNGYGECDQEAAALDDFIVFSRYPAGASGLFGDGSMVTVPAGYSHVRRPCTPNGPGDLVVGPLDASAEFVFSPVDTGASWRLADRAQTCADVSISRDQ